MRTDRDPPVTTPRVSLLASTYRSERFLPAWMQCMAAQTIWSQTELVVIANDPQPREDALLDEFARAHRQVKLTRVPREHISASLNRALELSTAPLIAMGNVDDLRTSTSLEAQVEALEANQDALFCYGTFTVTYKFPPEALDSNVVRVPEPGDEEFTRSMLLGPFYAWRRTEDPATKFFDQQLRVGADFDLAIRLALRGSGVKIADNLGFYYNGGTGLSTSGGRQSIERTVLELRYGIYDKIDYSLVPRAAEYVIPAILLPDQTWLPMTEIVAGYEQFLEQRRDRWADRGLRRWASSEGRLQRLATRIRRTATPLLRTALAAYRGAIKSARE
jgi:hypothetical protein